MQRKNFNLSQLEEIQPNNQKEVYNNRLSYLLQNQQEQNKLQKIMKQQNIQLIKQYQHTQYNNLKMVQIKHAIKILNSLTYKISYWNMFYGFKRLSTIEKPIDKIRNNKLKLLLQKKINKKHTNLSLKKYGFDRFYSNMRSIINNQHRKIILISHFIINQNYLKLSCAFQKLKKSKSLQQNLDKNQSHLLNKNEQKILKFSKQSQKLKVRILYTVFKKIIFDKNLLKSFSKIKNYEIIKHNMVKSKQMLGVTFGNENNLQNSKDLRFVKKKILPHKIIQGTDQNRYDIITNYQTLSNITINNWQIQSMKKKDFNFLFTIKKLINNKVQQYKRFFLSKLNIKSGISQAKQQSIKQQNKQFQNQQSNIFTNVLKHLCYISCQNSCENLTNQKKSCKQKATIQILETVHKTYQKVQQNIFYSIKLQAYKKYYQILQMVLELQQLKGKYLSYFNQDQSIVESENQTNTQSAIAKRINL